ncbi:CDP-glycerol glycerophosphotransferase family protein [Vagococcus fluvialis]|uniref:CDP-glycerol glycerophosphotransferase family protein n=1 Tax=Vagococcus fluvialis TaxID=2738 RepID=UPI002B2E1C16|nr:CDP-glycerol glycerophosphotransferase family protein [Vagococcus fluvialis]
MKALVEKFIGIIFKGIGLFHSSKTIYFESFHGTQFSDNPKAIYEWMKQEYPEYHLVWGVNKGQEKPFRDEKVSYVLRFSIKWFLTMPRAAVWVINTRTPLWLTKNKKTMYIQTWHGTPLKKIGRDIESISIPGYTKESYDQSFTEESKRWNYLVSPNFYSTEIFKGAFDFHGPVLEIGYPRNDILTKSKDNPVIKTKLKEKMGLPTNKRIILYAPTWRETANRKDGKYSFDTEFPFDDVMESVDENTLVLVRMHYLVAKEIDFTQLDERIIDASESYDMSELLAISDLLITDYSSSFFDYAITDSPILFFMTDKKNYEEEIRGFYFPIEESLPGPIAETKEELVDKITQWHSNEDLRNKNYKKFKNEFTSLEKGNASKYIAETIIKKGVTINGNY